MADFSLLDRFPATPEGHIEFLEFVRDEVRGALPKEKLSCEFPDEIESMIRDIRWSEASERIAETTDLPCDTVEQVAKVLRRRLTIGTVVQIDELLEPAVRELRNAWERRKNIQPDKVSNQNISDRAIALKKASNVARYGNIRRSMTPNGVPVRHLSVAGSSQVQMRLWTPCEATMSG